MNFQVSFVKECPILLVNHLVPVIAKDDDSEHSVFENQYIFGQQDIDLINKSSVYLHFTTAYCIHDI